MKEIQLTQGKVAFVDDGDYELVSSLKWSIRVCRLPSGRTNHYAVHRKTDKTTGKRSILRMHNFILGVTLIDHKDGDGLNNQRGNLRPVTHQQNMMNRNPSPMPKATSQFKGVSKSAKNKTWLARICIYGKTVHLGRHFNEIDAAIAYNNAAITYFGEFAALNTI